MRIRFLAPAHLAALVLLGGCMFYDEALLPSFGDGPAQQAAPATAAVAGSEVVGPGAADLARPARPPLAIVRFSRPDVAFEPALRAEVERALQAEPEAAFGLVAVSPAPGPGARVPDPEQAQRNIAAVARSLSELGVRAERLVFAATTSPQATVDEVHLYLLDVR